MQLSTEKAELKQVYLYVPRQYFCGFTDFLMTDVFFSFHFTWIFNETSLDFVFWCRSFFVNKRLFFLAIIFSFVSIHLVSSENLDWDFSVLTSWNAMIDWEGWMKTSILICTSQIFLRVYRFSHDLTCHCFYQEFVYPLWEWIALVACLLMSILFCQ